MRSVFICSVLSVLISFGLESKVTADGPVFNADVVSESANPDFILRDTNGVDWALEGGEPLADSFAISRANGAVSVLVLENNAPANSLRVNSNGAVGIGTSNPSGDLNILDVNGSGFAGIRSQESSGTPAIWDMTADSNAFELRETSASVFIAFRIQAGSPSLAIDSRRDGDVALAGGTLIVHREGGTVGIGTDLIPPAASLHILESNGSASIFVEELGFPMEKRNMLELSNNGAPQMLFTDTSQSVSWELNPNPNGNFIINSVGLGGATEFTLNGSNGNLRISGDMRAGDFIVTSSRDSKENFVAVDTQQVLQQVVDLPISQWNFKEEGNRKHIGPVAEDFKETFGLSGDGKRISMIDVNGVALAAIQGLKAKHDAELKEKSDEIAELKAEMAELKSIVSNLVALQRKSD